MIPPARVLVVRLGAMGDVLHALPAVAALRRARPDWEIGWVVDRRWTPLLESAEGSPVLDAVHVAATKDWTAKPVSGTTLRQIWELRGELQSVNYDVAVDMQGTIRSAVIGWMAGSKELVGYGDPKEAPARYMYGRGTERRGVHVVEQGCALLGDAAGVPLQPGPVELPVEPEAEAWAEELLNGERRICVLAPTAGWGAKEWPAERYGEVARELVAAGYGVVVNAASAEDPVAARVEEASEGTATAVLSTLPQLIALLRRSRLVIAGDTGPLHLAAALQRPVVGLFGPTDPSRNGPFGTPSRVLRDPASMTDYSHRSERDPGLIRISAGQVVSAAMNLLEGRPW